MTGSDLMNCQRNCCLGEAHLYMYLAPPVRKLHACLPCWASCRTRLVTVKRALKAWYSGS